MVVLGRGYVLGGVGPVVHQEELNVVDVADDEGPVARGHHELGLLVGTVADLREALAPLPNRANLPSQARLSGKSRQAGARRDSIRGLTYRGHGQVALEPPSDARVDTLGLPPAGVDALEAVTLVASEALRAYCPSTSISQFPSQTPTSGGEGKFVVVCFEGGGGSRDVRFFTMGVCFFAETICKTKIPLDYRRMRKQRRLPMVRGSVPLLLRFLCGG